MSENILYLEKRGCNFFGQDTKTCQLSDVGNYRVGVYDSSVIGKNGRAYVLEFTGYNKMRVRTTHKRTGKPLQTPVVEVALENALHVDTEFEENGFSWRDIQLEKELSTLDLVFTLSGILAAVNHISKKQYSKIEFLK